MSDRTETEKEKAKKYYPLPELSKNARTPNMEAYFTKWKESIENIEEFWAKEAKNIDWITPYEKVWVPPTGNGDDFVGKWFVGGRLNITHNCLDRWVEKGYGDETALIWMGEDDTV
ncbi:MAG: acetyl-coenzyme A synthetase N-terminal domain-containing protein, partial [Candidatus Hodarchaeota archaeon]